MAPFCRQMEGEVYGSSDCLPWVIYGAIGVFTLKTLLSLKVSN